MLSCVGDPEPLRYAAAGCRVSSKRAGNEAKALFLQAKLARWGGISGVIAGSSFVAIGLVGFVGSDTFLGWFGSDSSLDMSALYDRVQGLDFPLQAVATAIGLVLMVCTLGAVYARQAADPNLLGKIGLFASIAGVVLLLFGMVMATLASASLAGWVPVFSWEWYIALLFFVVGVPVLGLGLMISIVATVRARVLPVWARYGFATLLAFTLLALVVGVLIGTMDDRAEDDYIAGERTLESYSEISRTLATWGDVLGLTERVLFGLAWVVLGVALLAPAAMESDGAATER